MPPKVLSLLDDLLNVFYPEVCYACERPLMEHEEFLCAGCELELPRTRNHRVRENEMESTFKGRIALHSAASFLYFRKSGKVQKLLHRIKYNRARELSTWLGHIYGTELRREGYFDTLDLILPVPLHPRKLKQRGYNQSADFAAGLASALETEIREDLLLRTRDTPTQTRKTRYDRWKNVEKAFALKSLPAGLRHLAVVDDVITTGSTLEAAVKAVQKQWDGPVSVISLTLARD